MKNANFGLITILKIHLIPDGIAAFFIPLIVFKGALKRYHTERKNISEKNILIENNIVSDKLCCKNKRKKVMGYKLQMLHFWKSYE